MPRREPSKAPRAPTQSGARFTRDELALPAEVLAPLLLGSLVVRVLEGGTRVSGRIVEAEAYLGVKDRGCQSFRGHRSPRNQNMYAAAGTAYVYFTYGMHFMLNVVCGQEHEPVAVLLRALEPVEGVDFMRAARLAHSSQKTRLRDRDLCSGPGKICQALRIDRRFNGADLCAGGELFLERGGARTNSVARGPRVGVDCAGAYWARRSLRFWERGNVHVSRGSTSKFVVHKDRPTG